MRHRAGRPARHARRVLQISALVVAAVAMARSITVGGSPDPFRAQAAQARPGIARTDAARSAIRAVEHDPGSDIGRIRLSPSAADALTVLVNQWERSDDLRRIYSATDPGSPGRPIPDTEGLLDWAMTTSDARSIALLAWQGPLLELSDTLGRVRSDGDLVGPLIVRSRARRHRSVDADDALFAVAGRIRERPDLRERFVVDGKVRIRQIAEWAAAVAPDDPDRASLVGRAPVFARLLGDIGD